MMEGDNITIIISIIALVFSGVSTAWAVLKTIIDAVNDRKLAVVRKCLDKNAYVSNVIFDKIFAEFQKISECLFNNVSDATTKLFPRVEQVLCRLPYDKKIEQMRKYENEAIYNANELIKLTQINCFILPENILKQLEEAEDTIRELIVVFQDKIKDAEGNVDVKDRLVQKQEEVKYQKKSDELSRLVFVIETEIRKYLNSLQVIYK